MRSERKMACNTSSGAISPVSSASARAASRMSAAGNSRERALPAASSPLSTASSALRQLLLVPEDQGGPPRHLPVRIAIPPVRRPAPVEDEQGQVRPRDDLPAPPHPLALHRIFRLPHPRGVDTAKRNPRK